MMNATDIHGLSKLRFCYNMSRSELRKLSGLSYLTIRNIENKKSKARPGTINKLAKAFLLTHEEIREAFNE